MGFFSNLKDALRIDDEEEDDDIAYEKEMQSYERKEKKKKEPKRRPKKVEEVYYEEPKRKYKRAEETYYEEPEEEPYYDNVGSFDSSGRFTPPRSPESYHNVAPRRNNVYKQADGSETTMLRVRGLNDARLICDYLLNGRPVVVNFERATTAEAQRIMDFMSGCVYTIKGNLQPISDKVFMLSPHNVDVSGDYVNMMQKNSFGVPTFNKMI